MFGIKMEKKLLSKMMTAKLTIKSSKFSNKISVYYPYHEIKFLHIFI